MTAMLLFPAAAAAHHQSKSLTVTVDAVSPATASPGQSGVTVSFTVAHPDGDRLTVSVSHDGKDIYRTHLSATPPLQIAFTVPTDAQPDWHFALSVTEGDRKGSAAIPLTIQSAGPPGALAEVPYPVVLPALLLTALLLFRRTSRHRRFRS